MSTCYHQGLFRWRPQDWWQARVAPALELSKQRVRISITRWFRVLLVGLVCAITFDMVLPYAWLFTKDLTLEANNAYQICIFWILIGACLYLSSEPIRINRHQIRGYIRYPPIWFSVVFGLFLTGAREQWLPNSGIHHFTDVTNPVGSFPIGWVAALIAIGAVCIRWMQSPSGNNNTTNQNIIQDDNITPDSVQTWIESGERPRESDEPDFFAHRPLVKRIANKLESNVPTVGLLGSVGSGKSSILNAVQAELNGMERRIIVAKIDVWPVDSPEDVPSLALNQIINALDQLVDTIELRGLAQSYKRLATAEPSGWISRILRVDTSRDSLEVLKRLLPILDVFDVRLVLMVEDVERAGKDFDNRHLMRFLWAFRQLRRCGFVLAIDPSANVDMTKLCDTIERVPMVKVEQAARIFLSAYQSWISAHSDIEPRPNREGADRFKFRTTDPDRLYYELGEYGWESEPSDLLDLLQIPRAFKHVMCRVDQVWNKLHGEAELDEILIICALRYGAPDAYEFLLRHIDIARMDPGTWKPDIEALDKFKDEWKKFVESIPNGRSVQALVDLLEIKALHSGDHVPLVRSPQGVHMRDPVDYFSRIVAEELAPTELRDQDVLQDIRRWEIDQEDSLINRLVPENAVDDHYLRVWSNLAVQLGEQDIIDLTMAVVERALSIYGPSIELAHPALVTILEKSRLLSDPEYTNLFTWMTRISISHSLSFVNQLVAYHADNFGGGDHTVKELRTSAADSARKKIRTEHDLVRVVSGGSPSAILEFVTLTINDPDIIEEWRVDLAHLILSGVQIDPETMMPQLVNLAVDHHAVSKEGSSELSQPSNRYDVDRQRMTWLFQGQLDEALTVLAEYEGNDLHAIRVRDSARRWQAEKLSQGSSI